MRKRVVASSEGWKRVGTTDILDQGQARRLLRAGRTMGLTILQRVVDPSGRHALLRYLEGRLSWK